MAARVCNIAKGRVNELVNRVKNNDPANSAIVLILLANTGLESIGTLVDYDTVAALLAAANDEATNTGYARKVLTDAQIAAAPTPDDTNDLMSAILGDQSYTMSNDGTGAVGAVLTAYDSDTTGGNDTNLVPLTVHVLASPWTPNGAPATLDEPATGFFKAQEP